MKCFTPIPDLALAVRTDASIGHLQAFLDHHLRNCEKAYVLVDCRPGEDGGQVFALLEEFGDRVLALRHEQVHFHNGNTCDALSEFIRESGWLGVVLHLDKDEFVSDWDGMSEAVSRIRDGASDCAEGVMMCRLAPGGKLYPDRAQTYEEFLRIAPVRAKLLADYGFEVRKCVLTRSPHIKIHYGLPEWKTDGQRFTLDHFRWVEDLQSKTSVKLIQHPQQVAGCIHWRDRNAWEQTDDFKLRLRRAFHPLAWQLPGWMDYGDLFRRLVEWIPEGGVFVELGVWQGRSLSYFCEYATLIGKKVVAFGYDQFDPEYYLHAPRAGMTSDEWLEEVRSNLRRHCPWNAPELRRSDSSAAASLHPEESVDILWIDAGHDAESVFNDITAWKPRMKKTGIMAGHDINLAGVREGLTRAGISYKATSKSSWISEVSSQASVPWI